MVIPYLIFAGRCQEALDFYHSALGAEVQMVMKFNEMPDFKPEHAPPGYEDKIMHSSISLLGQSIYLSDGSGQDAPLGGFSLSLHYKDAASAHAAFDALADGGEVTMPIQETFWAPVFGMLKDKFGVAWMVTVDGPGPA